VPTLRRNTGVFDRSRSYVRGDVRHGDSLVRVSALFCLLGVGESAFVPFLPLLLRARGLDAQAIGAVLALFAAIAFTSGPLWGFLADRALGYERTLELGLGGAVGAALLLRLAHTAGAVAAAGALLFAFRTPFMAMADSIALARLGPERRSAYGSIRLWMSAGFAVGAIAFGLVVQAVGLGLVAPLYASLCALNAVFFALAFRARAVVPREPAEGVPTQRFSLSVAPALGFFLVALFLAYAAYNATYNFAAVRIAALGGGAVFVGLAAGLQASAEVPAMAWTRRLSRRFRPGTVFAAGAAIYAAVYVVWAVAASPVSLAVLRLVAGIGFGLTYVGAVLLVDELVPARLRATGQAASKSVSFGLAPVAGSLGGGAVYGYLGPTVFFLAAAATTGVAAVVARWSESARTLFGRPKLEHA
jgi:MFS transporter, PPP family, 3-phenylpropionic acid transporter